jgi:ligand-binding sensor domain-containing protein/uncharacterized protein YoxC
MCLTYFILLKNIGMRFKPVFAIFVLFVISSFILFSQQQNYPFHHLSIENGLSQSNVQCVIQDQDGFLWFGTQDGLNKYDGYQFRIYRNSQDNENSISGNRIEDIVEGPDGRIWIATYFNGISSYHKETNDFVQYKNKGDLKNSSWFKDSRNLFVDADGRLWAFFKEGIGWYDPDNDTFEYSESADFFGDACGVMVSSVVQYSSDELLFCTNSCPHLYFYNKKSGNVEAVPLPKSELFESFEKSLYSDSEDDIWIGDVGGGLFHYNQNFELENHFGAHSGSPLDIGSLVRDFEELRNGQYWVGMDADGIYVIDEDKQNSDHQKFDKMYDKSLAGNTVYDIFEDETGIVWVCHFSDGISYFDPNAMRFKTFSHNPNNPASLSPNPVLSVFEDSNGRVWVGTDGGGLNLFNKEDGTFRHFTVESHGFTTNVITAISEDGKGNLLLGTWGGGFMVFNPDTGYLRSFLNDGYTGVDDVILNHVWNFEQDKTGIIWLGILGSPHAYYFDPETQEISTYEELTGNRNVIEAQIMTSMKDSNGDIWFGTEGGGVYQYVVDQQEMVVYKSKPDGLASDVVFTIHEDSDGNIWMGTLSSGISIYDPDGNSFNTINKESGLPSNGIMGILEDDGGNFWISTTNGVCKYNPVEEEYTNFTEKDGLQGREFKYNSSLRDSEGYFYFGGFNGINVFKPEEITKNDHLLPVYFTDFKIFNKSVDFRSEDSPLDKDISATRSIELKHSQNLFEISFVGLNYTATEDNQYKYKMIGFDEDYILTKERSVSYMNLTPGDYTFHVMASNNDGVWNNEGASLEITILPPWWGTWWFRILVFLLITGGVLLFFRWRTAKLRESQRELKQKVDEATQEVERRNENLAQAQTKLQSIMDDVKNELGKASQQLLEATNSEAASVEEMSASIEQMATDINETAGGTSKMLNVTRGIEKDTEKVVKIVADTMNAISDIDEGIGSISDFARKTNLISLNASIEAARAGEFGRSFAVVAGEIKKLADQSQGVALNISKLSKTGLGLSADANEKIAGLFQYVQNIVSLISQINESSHNQSEQASNINVAIQQIEDYVTSTAALAEKLDNAIRSLSLDK